MRVRIEVNATVELATLEAAYDLEAGMCDAVEQLTRPHRIADPDMFYGQARIAGLDDESRQILADAAEDDE